MHLRHIFLDAAVDFTAAGIRRSPICVGCRHMRPEHRLRAQDTPS